MSSINILSPQAQQLVAGLEPQLDLLIIDDVFPHPLSAFRLEEYTYYLRRFEKIRILTNGWSLPHLGTETKEELVDAYVQKHPELAQKVLPWCDYTLPDGISAKLAYFCFLSNAYHALSQLERLQIPFVFELYPGGAFSLDNARSDFMLRAVTSSPCFQKVIVTQEITRAYLLKKGFCRPEQIISIFGVVMPADKLSRPLRDKRHYGIDKKRLDVCFAAFRYTPHGEDKGYDLFIQVAKELCKRCDDIYFHVVGSFDESVIDVSDIRDRICFYGCRESDWFEEFYRDKDIFLSPNRANMLAPGAFDGFPTASCTDAGLWETAMFCSDPLLLNSGHYRDGLDIKIIPTDADTITEIILNYREAPKKLAALGRNGRKRIVELYGEDAQLATRAAVLQQGCDAYRQHIEHMGHREKDRTVEDGAEFVQAKLYVDLGRGFCEEDTTIQDMCIHRDGSFSVHFTAEMAQPVMAVRFDPLEGRYIRCCDVRAVSAGQALAMQPVGCMTVGEQEWFLTTDPQYTARSAPSPSSHLDIEIEGSIFFLTMDEVLLRLQAVENREAETASRRKHTFFKRKAR